MGMEHEFGLLPQEPPVEKRFDAYEPHGCIRVHDDWIEPIAEKLEAVPSFYHSRSVPGTGLAYCGITLFAPSSLGLFQQILREEENDAYAELLALLERARREHKYVIHFGL